MRAIGVRAFGPPSKLEYLDVPEPVITGPEDIAIAVHAVGLNPGDPIRAAGWSKLIETVKLPQIIGHDFAGTISSVGPRVTAFSPGDRVFGFTTGARAAAQYLLLTPSIKHCIAKIPDSISFIDAASFPTVGITVVESARRADMELGGLGSLKGKTVLVPGGLSGVGSLAVQVLKQVYGAGKVITTVSPGKMALVEDFLGPGVADQIVNYTLGPAHVMQEIGKGTVDLMLDTAFMAMGYLPVLKKGGLLLTITGKEGWMLKDDWPEIGTWLVWVADVLDWWYKWRAGRWGVRYENVFVRPNGADLDVLAGWLVEGKAKPVIGRVVEWEDLEGVKALCQLIHDRKGGVGKYVIDLRSLHSQSQSAELLSPRRD